MTVNTKQERVKRCRICKYHSKTSFSSFNLESPELAKVLYNKFGFTDRTLLSIISQSGLTKGDFLKQV